MIYIDEQKNVIDMYGRFCLMHQLENFIGTNWVNYKAPSDSDCSLDAANGGFNYDSKYLIQVSGLPWSVTKPKIAEFFENILFLNGNQN